MLDITAFSNALRSGTVSYTRPLGANVVMDRSDRIKVHVGEDAAVYPLQRGGTPVYALRIPLGADAARSWPERYADLQAESGGIHRFLPAELTLLDSESSGEPDLVLLYRWVPGDSLADVIRRRAPTSRLDALVHSLAELAETLRTSGLAHGDIAPGNLIVRPDDSVVLIDLDRMGPARRGGVIPRRRPGYRLADTSAGPEAEDAFALLVLMTTVSVVSGMGDMPMDVETDRGSHPPLVFSSWDLMDPGHSELVRHLRGKLTGVPALLLEYLVGACSAPAGHIPQILAEAIHDVRRASRGVQSRVADVPGIGTAPDSGWASGSPGMFDTWGRDSWPSSTFATSESGQRWTARDDTGEILERIAELASRDPSSSDPRSRFRNRVAARREHVAQELRGALATNDRKILVRLAMSGDIAELGESNRSDLVMVLRALSYDHIARAVASDEDSAIIAAIDSQIFPSDQDIDEAFRPRVLLARTRDRWVADVIEAVQRENRDRCVELVSAAPRGGAERLPVGIRRRLQRLTDIATLAKDIRRALDQRNINAVVGPMARLSALVGNWTEYVDADEVVGAVGYPRIRQRVIDRLASGDLTGEDQWLIDCVVGMGDIVDVARSSGKSRDEVETMLAPRQAGRSGTVVNMDRSRRAN